MTLYTSVNKFSASVIPTARAVKPPVLHHKLFGTLSLSAIYIPILMQALFPLPLLREPGYNNISYIHLAELEGLQGHVHVDLVYILSHIDL